MYSSDLVCNISDVNLFLKMFGSLITQDLKFINITAPILVRRSQGQPFSTSSLMYYCTGVVEPRKVVFKVNTTVEASNACLIS